MGQKRDVGTKGATNQTILSQSLVQKRPVKSVLVR
jgi:hypothetical protein